MSFSTGEALVRGTLHCMEDFESDYLNPVALTPAQVEKIYSHRGKDDDCERRFGRAAFAALRQISRDGQSESVSWTAPE